MSELYLTPPVAALIFLAVVVCGHNFRKDLESSRRQGWQKRAWLFGVPAGIGLLVRLDSCP